MIVRVVVTEMLSSVPVLRCFPPVSLLSLTRWVLSLCRLDVLKLVSVLVTLLPMRFIVWSMFPLRQCAWLLLCSLMVLRVLAEVLSGIVVCLKVLEVKAILVLRAGPLCELRTLWVRTEWTLATAGSGEMRGTGGWDDVV